MSDIYAKGKRIKYRKYLLVFCLFLFFLFCFWINQVEAASATLFFSPPSGTYNFGDNFSVFVKLDSGGSGINAAEGSIIFNPAELSVTSISKSGSIFTLWTTEPTFSNTTGNITFGGGTPSNFNGNSGTIFKITFKTKATATAQVNFSSGSVLAADGKGTNILSTMSGATYIIRSVSVLPPVETPEENAPEATPGEPPLAPVISGSTHTDTETWYSNNSPEFSWKLPSDVTAVSLMLTNDLDSNPGNISDGLITSKKFENIEDGTWYFHIKFKNESGWGEITHRKVLIDTQAPEPFEITVQRQNTVDPQPNLVFKAEDLLSGIDYYEVKIGSGTFKVTPEEIEDSPYKMPFQLPGQYLIEVKAVDKAGNSISALTDIEIFSTGESTFLKFGKIAIDYLTIVVTLILLTVGTAAIIFYGFFRISLWRKKVRRETKEVSKAVYAAFKTLKDEVQKQIENLDLKAGLTSSEKKVRNKLKETLDISEKFINKEIKDIEKELK